jgi:hypothetical protein
VEVSCAEIKSDPESAFCLVKELQAISTITIIDAGITVMHSTVMAFLCFVYVVNNYLIKYLRH